MPFKIIGADENGNLPTRVVNKLKDLFPPKDVATTTTPGLATLATSAETAAGASSTKAVTPAGLKSVTDPMNTAIGSKAESTALAPIKDELTNRLSDTKIRAGAIDAALTVERDGSYPVGLFTRLRQGIMTRTMTTKVVVLGDSHAVGGYTNFYEQGFMQRLAYRSGAKTYRMLSDATSPVPGGMNWWSGAVGGRTTANYCQTPELQKIAIVQPHYALHFIGSNDWSQQIPVTTFKANLQAAINAIVASSPGVINVLIHGQKRKDTTSPIPYASYGQAMEEIAAANPTSVAFINVSDSFDVFGLNSDNYAGILLTDNTHMGNVGHRFMADLLSGIMGVPMESRFDLGVDVRNMPIPTKKSYSAVEVASTFVVEAASYPRIAELTGSWFVNSSHANGEIAIQVFDEAGNATLDGVNIRIGSTGDRSVNLGASVYIKPGMKVALRIVIAPVSGTNIVLSGLDDYFKVRANIEAI